MHVAFSEQKHPMYAHKSKGEKSHAFLARELPCEILPDWVCEAWLQGRAGQ
jgi:hypothetical protein